MNESNRERIIALMVDSPEKLTQSDVEAITNDSELRDIYEISRRLRPETTAPKDLDAEWMLFQRKLYQRRHKAHWRRIAASIAIVLAISATAAVFMAPTLFMPTPVDMVSEEIGPSTAPASAPASAVVAEMLPVEDEVFDNMKIAEIMERISEIYGCEYTIEESQNINLRLYFVLKAGQTLEETVKMLDAFAAFEVSLNDGVVSVK